MRTQRGGWHEYFSSYAMNEDKSIAPKDLPRPQQDVDTRQAEEYIDKNGERKDAGDMPAKDRERQNDEPRQRNQ